MWCQNAEVPDSKRCSWLQYLRQLDIAIGGYHGFEQGEFNYECVGRCRHISERPEFDPVGEKDPDSTIVKHT